MTTTQHINLKSFLAGRIWHRQHTPFPIESIDARIASGELTVIPGIKSKKSKHFCNRCENEDQTRFTTFNCTKCGGPCAYCRHCLKMGRVSSCTELVSWNGEPQLYPTTHQFAWEGTLTALQQKASVELDQSSNQGKPHLIHAVCGSGKTEILFQPIYNQLTQGQRICIAAPRVDVILELEPRLRSAFPKTRIEALYGGAEPEKFSAQLVLATTHQLYRFQKAFDVIYVDEADAFPYTADETLRKAVQKAAKPKAPIHSVTATPSAKLIAEIKRNGSISTIRRRYHGHPLPIPRYDSLWNYNKHIQKEKLPKKLQNWTEQRLEKQEPFLIFFHSIQRMKEAAPLFQKINPKIYAVHASSDDRKEKVQALRNQEIPGLLTTTILERGITIPNVQVAVVGAEQKIFNKGGLIQIGGRIGRSFDYPKGDFVLFHHGISHAMDDAKSELIRLNKGGVSHDSMPDLR